MQNGSAKDARQALLSEDAAVESEEEVNLAPSRKARKVSIGDVPAAPAEPDAPPTPPRKNR